jgi:hypothetical protein
MFESDDFSKSRQYFATLQTLRLCNDWITETIQDMRHIRDKIYETVNSTLINMPDDVRVRRSQEHEHLDKILSRLITDCETIFQPLLSRIERKNEEIKGLRDGVSLYTLSPFIRFPQRSFKNTHRPPTFQCYISQRSIQGNQSGREQCSAEPLHSRFHGGYHFLPPNELCHRTFSLFPSLSAL